MSGQRMLDLAVVHACIGIALGLASASGRLPRWARPLHHVAFFGATAGTVAVVVLPGSRRQRRPIGAALAMLACLPRTRPGTGEHAMVATVATCALVAGNLARRRAR